MNIKSNVRTDHLKTLADLAKQINKTNIATLIISIVSIFTIQTFKLTLDSRFQKKFRFPFPIDLLVVIRIFLRQNSIFFIFVRLFKLVISTSVVFAAKLDTKYSLDVVGSIPKG